MHLHVIEWLLPCHRSSISLSYQKSNIAPHYNVPPRIVVSLHSPSQSTTRKSHHSKNIAIITSSSILAFLSVDCCIISTIWLSLSKLSLLSPLQLPRKLSPHQNHRNCDSPLIHHPTATPTHHPSVRFCHLSICKHISTSLPPSSSPIINHRHLRSPHRWLLRNCTHPFIHLHPQSSSLYFLYHHQHITASPHRTILPRLELHQVTAITIAVNIPFNSFTSFRTVLYKYLHCSVKNAVLNSILTGKREISD